MFLNAEQIFNLLAQKKITESHGKINFNFLDVSVDIKDKSAIGDLFQEWFAKWMESNQIQYRISSNTQEFPDFFLDPQSNHQNLLEIKTFNSKASPAFDVANFEAYCHSIKTKAYRLDADYLIFAYTLDEGNFSIKKLWCKKIWEITGNSDKYPVRCQVKKDGIYNIRPVTWYSTKAKFEPFGNRRRFVEALHQTLMQYLKTKISSQNWLDVVEQNYLSYTGQKL